MSKIDSLKRLAKAYQSEPRIVWKSLTYTYIIHIRRICLSWNKQRRTMTSKKVCSEKRDEMRSIGRRRRLTLQLVCVTDVHWPAIHTDNNRKLARLSMPWILFFVCCRLVGVFSLCVCVGWHDGITQCLSLSSVYVFPKVIPLPSTHDCRN